MIANHEQLELERIGIVPSVGLLPHEASFVLKSMQRIIKDAKIAQDEYQENITSHIDRIAKYQSSGVSSAYKNLKASEVQIFGQLAKIAKERPILAYPSRDDLRVSYGSRVTIERDTWTDLIDIATHEIPTFEPSPNVTIRTPANPIGAAMMQKVAGQYIDWKLEDGITHRARILDVDQEAQQNSYEIDL